MTGKLQIYQFNLDNGGILMEKPIVLVIMDGVGKGDGGSGDAVAVAKTPTLDNLLATCPHTYLKAHGTAVGLPSD